MNMNMYNEAAAAAAGSTGNVCNATATMVALW